MANPIKDLNLLNLLFRKKLIVLCTPKLDNFKFECFRPL